MGKVALRKRKSCPFCGRGNLVYVFGVDAAATSAARAHLDGGLPYPKAVAA